MAFDPSLIDDSKRRFWTVDKADVDSAQTGLPVPLVFSAANGNSEMVDDLAPVGQGEHPYLPTPTNHYTMDNISGSTLTDEKGDTDGTITNMTQSTGDGGKFGECLEGGASTPSSRYVDLGSSQVSFRSWSGWIRIINTSNYGVVIANSAGSAFYVDTSGNLVCWNGSDTPDTSLNITDINWHHVVMVGDVTGNWHLSYVDGVSGTSIQTNLGGNFRYLGSTTSTASWDICDFDNVQVFDEALTQAQVTALYNAEYPLYKKLSVEQSGSQIPVEVVPGEWDTKAASLYPVSLTTWYAGGGAQSYRLRIDADEVAGDSGRLKLKFGRGSNNYVITKCYIGLAASSGNNWDFDGDQVQVTFDGGDADTTISADGQLSDPIDFDFDGTTDLIISIYSTSGASQYNTTQPTGGDYWYKASSDEAATTAPSGFSSSTSWPFIIDIIDNSPEAVIYCAPDLFDSADSVLTVSWDETQDDNVEYVGLTGDTPYVDASSGTYTESSKYNASTGAEYAFDLEFATGDRKSVV